MFSWYLLYLEKRNRINSQKCFRQALETFKQENEILINLWHADYPYYYAEHKPSLILPALLSRICKHVFPVLSFIMN